METSARDFAAVRVVREARHEAVALSAGGRVHEVLGCVPESPMSLVYVVKLLDVHPRLGKVKGRRLLASVGLDEFTRVGDLTPGHIEAILEACGETA